MRSAVTVTTSATVILAASQYSKALVQNVSASTVYLQYTKESTALTIANGIQLLAGESLEIQQNDEECPAILGIVASGTAEVRIAAD